MRIQRFSQSIHFGRFDATSKQTTKEELSSDSHSQKGLIIFENSTKIYHKNRISAEGARKENNNKTPNFQKWPQMSHFLFLHVAWSGRFEVLGQNLNSFYKNLHNAIIFFDQQTKPHDSRKAR